MHVERTACVLTDRELLSEKWDLGHGVENRGNAGSFTSG